MRFWFPLFQLVAGMRFCFRLLLAMCVLLLGTGFDGVSLRVKFYRSSAATTTFARWRLIRDATFVVMIFPVWLLRPCNGSFHVIARANPASRPKRHSPSRLRQARMNPRLLSSTEYSVSQRRPAGALLLPV